jgi:hypothetical protein
MSPANGVFLPGKVKDFCLFCALEQLLVDSLTGKGPHKASQIVYKLRGKLLINWYFLVAIICIFVLFAV